MAHQMDSITINLTANASDAVRSIQRLQSSMASLQRESSSLGSAFDKSASGIKRFVTNINSVNKKMFSVGDGIKSVIGGLIGYHGILTALNWGKTTVKLGAAMTEINHIVESVFSQDMVGYVEKWSQDAIKQFGIAEQSAKQYAGTLSAMFQASGVTQKNAGKMATDLVGLAGDLSSFFNVDTAEAFEKIRSGMSGMVRPLRAMGIDMTAATLQEFALTQGITKSYQAMSQAEKVMLRYQYLMYATSRQQGDFARTSESMANRLRTLSAYMNAIGTQLGTGLVAALRHVIGWLNTAASAALRAAKAFAVFMTTVFGNYKGGASGIAVDSLAESLEDAGDAVASGLGSGAGSAAKIKKDLALLPFDELNQLAKDSSSGGGGGGGGAGGGVGGGIFDDLEDLTNGIENSILPQAISKLGEAIKKKFQEKDWQGLGELLAQPINDGLEKLNGLFTSSTLITKINTFAKDFAKTLNGLTSGINWNNLGTTLANGINTVIGFLETGIRTYNWKALGTGLGNAMLGFIDTINTSTIGAYLGGKFQAILDVLNSTLVTFGKTGWATLGSKLNEGIKSINDHIDLGTLGSVAAQLINGLFTTLGGLADKETWKSVGTNIVNGLATFIGDISWTTNAKNLKDFVMSLYEAIDDMIKETPWEGLGEALGEKIEDVKFKDIKSLWGEIYDLFTAPDKIFVDLLIGIHDFLYSLGNELGDYVKDKILQYISDTLPAWLGGGFYEPEPEPKEKVPLRELMLGGEERKQSLKEELYGGGSKEELAKETQKINKKIDLYQGFTQLFGKFNKENQKSAQQTTNASTTMVEKMVNMTQSAFEKVSEGTGKAGAKSATSYADKMSSKKNYLSSKTGETVQTGLNKVYSILGISGGSGNSSKYESIGATSATSTAQGWLSKSQGVIDAVSGTFSTAISANVTNGVSKDFNKAGKDLADSANTGFKSGFGDTTNWLGSMLSGAAGVFSKNKEDKTNGIPAKSKELGASGKSGFNTGFGDPATNVDSKLQKVKDTMVQPGTIAYLNGAGVTVGSTLKGAMLGQMPTGSDMASKVNENTQGEQKEKMTNIFSKIGNALGKAMNYATSEGITFSGEDAAWKMQDNSKNETKDSYIATMKSKIMNKLAGGISSGTSSALTYSGGDAAWKIKNNSDSGSGYTNLVSNSQGIGSKIGSNIWPGISPQLPSGNDIATKIKNNVENDTTGKTNVTTAGTTIGNWLSNAIQGVKIPKPHISVSTTPKTILGITVNWPTFSLSWYKRGGLFMGGDGQTIGVAEGGKNEAVLPLENPRSMRMIADAIVGDNNFGGSGMDENKLADAIASRLVPYLGGGSDKYISNEIYLDGDRIAKSVSKAQRKHDNRFNPTPQLAY